MSINSEDKHDGENKIKPSRIITKPIRIPFNWIMPRTVIQSTKQFKFRNKRYPLCPNCQLARFQLDTRKNDDDLYVWFCPKCELQAETVGNDIVDIQEWCHVYAKQIYRESEYTKERLADNENTFVAVNVKKNMFACYTFLFLGLLMSLVFLIGAWNVYILLTIYSMFIAIFFYFMALIFNYRAWQAETGNIYNKDGKAVFNWWVKTHPWYRKPKDIGTPPSEQSK